MASVIGTGAFQKSWPVERLRDSRPSLTDLVEREIIPRLVLAHDADAQADVAPPEIHQTEIDALAPLALCASADLLLDRIEQFLDRGMTTEQVMIHLLAPTARRLGIWWEEDRCDFVEVTMGLWRLQEVVREITMRATPAHFGGAGSRRALFSAAPGEQHDFGPIMVSETFRLAGWDVDTVIGGDMSELLERVASAYFDIVGLTVSCDCHSGRLPSIIHALRSVSRNPRLRVLVGGRVFCENSGLAIEIGADGTAPDASAAVIIAEGLVDALERYAA